MAAGNKHLAYKESLNAAEQQSPGTKNDFYFSFLRKAADKFVEAEDHPLGVCQRCGAPAGNEVCSFCRIVEKASTHEPVPVELVKRKYR